MLSLPNDIIDPVGCAMMGDPNPFGSKLPPCETDGGCGENPGSRVSYGLGCRNRDPLTGWTIPGETDDNVVGVDVLLHTPGELEYLVEGLLAEANAGVGGGRFCMFNVVRRLASSFGPWDRCSGGSVDIFSRGEYRVDVGVG